VISGLQSRAFPFVAVHHSFNIPQKSLKDFDCYLFVQSKEISELPLDLLLKLLDFFAR
jgi:hypothetical protein